VPRIDLAIEKDWAWGGASGAGVTVAVVDSGVDAAHPAVGAVDRAIRWRWDAESEQAVSAGLRWAIAEGARVVNLSLSTSREDYSELFHDIADEAAFAGVVLVCATNNVPAPTYPAQFSSVISVAAHDGQDPFALDVNPAPPADFGAPGIDVEVPWLSGGSIVATGNSFAAPHVTGLVARLLSKHPQLTPYEVKTVLRAVASNAVRGETCDGR